MVYERSCTDMICCVVFLLFIACMGGVSVYAFQEGDPWKILTPFDSDGNRCGFPDQSATPGLGVRDFTEYKYKFYTDLTKANPLTAVYGENNVYTAVCVKECPAYPIGTVPTTLEVDYMVTTTNTKSPIRFSLFGIACFYLLALACSIVCSRIFFALQFSLF